MWGVGMWDVECGMWEGVGTWRCGVSIKKNDFNLPYFQR